MTLQQIFTIIDDNIKTNNGTLRLSPNTIESEEIDKLFTDYLLYKDLVVKEAKAKLNADNVSVEGQGDSLIFYKTTIKSLVFTVDENGTPSMSVNAEANIKSEEGWTFGASFPILETSNWGGFKDPANATKWIQYIFFDSGNFSLSKNGLQFRGFLKFEKGLEPLSVLFKGMDKAEVTGPITLNKGEDGWIPTEKTVMPEMTLRVEIGKVTLPIGDFTFTLSFQLLATAFIIKEGPKKGMPAPSLEMLIQSTLPINDEEVGVAISVGNLTGTLTMRAVLPENTEIGMPELISLANNSNVLAVMPSNMPVISDFVLKDWQLTFDAKAISLTQVSISVGTRKTFSWGIIPRYVTLEEINFTVDVTYFNKVAQPSLTIDGIIGFGDPNDPLRFQISAAFPSYVFMGSFMADPPEVVGGEKPKDLKPVIKYFLGDAIANSLPDTLKLAAFDMSIDPKNSTYSASAALVTDLDIPLGITTVTVKQVAFNFDYVAGSASGSITGDFKVGEAEDSPVFTVTAGYDGDKKEWSFSGALTEGSKINLKEIIDRYLPAEYHQFNILNITIDKLSLTFNKGVQKRYEFLFGAFWIIELGLGDDPKIAATVKVAYDSEKPVGKQYTGFIDGSLSFGNIKVGARVDFKEGSKDYTFYLNAFQAKLTHNADNDSIICFTVTDNTSLGDVIALLVNAATSQDITLPAPWNVLNNIKLKDFAFSFNITKKKIGLSYKPGINFGFIKIDKITLFYTYGDTKKVEIAITQGSFLGGAQPLPKPWDVLDPAAAPEVPGQGPKVFQLDFLGMGQHVSLKSGLNPNSVSEAVQLLKDNFEKKKTGALPGTDKSPIGDTGLQFNSNSNWLIGTEFVILETFNLGIVFFDPDVYGLSIYVNGPKAKVFQGLKFEILYKKVTDTVGVYQIYLKLPDSIRQLDFGSVSVTLPSIRLYIYTNGDFKVDFGFPLNDNFSESFGLQMLPFVGAGGFYFGVLSAATASKIPETTKGNFSPVIVFGVGIRVGIGKEIDKGIMKAGLSVTVQGILEGTFAQYNSFDGGNEDVMYYYILGKIAIVGHLYGAINFAIISAELDIRLFVSARIVLETAEPILLTFEAGVSVSLKVKINLGIFSFSISLSFSATVRESFKIGQPGKKPWKSISMPFRAYALRALDSDQDCLVIPPMKWLPILPDTKIGLPMMYIPQMSVGADSVNPDQSPRLTAMLYLETSVDQPLVPINPKGIGEDEDLPFTKFAKGVLLWTLGAFINKTSEGIKVDDILNTSIKSKSLSEILCYFNVKDRLQPFEAKDILTFMENYMDVTITVPPRVKTDEKQASIFPMLPNLSFVTPSGTIYFNDEKAKYTYDAKQLELIRDLLRELSVRASNNQSAPQTNALGDEAKQSLASYMLVDYVALLAKEAIQRAIDTMASHVVPAPYDKTLNEIVAENANYGISAKELAFANRTRPLNAGVGLRVTGVRYTVKEGDTTEAVLHRFNVEKEALLRANSFRKVVNVNPCTVTPLWTETPQSSVLSENGQLLPGSTLTIPEIVHTTSANRVESLLSVANHYAVNVHSLIEDNIDVPALFHTGKNLRVPFVEEMVVKDLIKAMQDKHDFEHMAGLSANIMLQGLRVPLPEPDSKIGKPEALYIVTGQEIAAMPQVGEELSLAIEASLPWLNLGTVGGISVPFVIEPQDINDLQTLAGTALTPRLLKLQALDLFNIQPKKYTLPSHVEWTSPQAIQLANGSNYLQASIDPSIWAFKNNLQSLISGANAIKPKVALLRQVQETVNLTADPVPVQNYSWSTTFNVQLRQVRKAEAPTELMPNVYEVQGIDQGGMSLLRDLIDFYGKNPGATIIKEIQFLYTKDPAQEGQKEPPTGLKSDSIANTTVFLLQTNLSTLSNPSPMLQRLVAGVPGEQPNLLGMKQIEFLRFVWEAAIVGTGGYYFYYLINDSKAGLPDYLFNDDKDATITLLITYDITDNVLQNFLNSVVIRDKIDIASEILYIETIGKAAVAGEVQFDNKIDVKVATVPSGTMGFDMKRRNPALRKDVAQAEKDLEELFNLLEFNIGPNNDFDKTSPGLPVGPGNRAFKPSKDPDVVLRPTSITEEDWEYERIVRVYPFIKTSAEPVMVQKLLADQTWGGLLSPNDIPPEKENPYRATGKSVMIEMRWVDIFGNLTNFTNTSEPGVPTELPPFTMGYIDPVTGIDQYPSITAAYIIEKNESAQAELRVTLAFNPSKYQPANEGDTSWKERARVDREAYKNIYYQLSQQDVKLTVTNTLQNNTANVLDEPKATLLAFVLEIYQYLGSLLGPLSTITGKAIDPPANKVFTQPVSDNNPAPLFALVTRLTISRDVNLVDKNFKDEPSVIAATSIAGPDLRKLAANVAAGEDTSITIQEFARKLEAAFPKLKVASGLSQAGAEKDSNVDIWLMRFDTAANGIDFSITNKNKPFYFALQPLSTFLLSRDSVLIYPYTPGTPIYDSTPRATAFNGVDLEKLAEAFLNAVDVFLQADFSIPAWKIENASSLSAGSGTIDIPHPYQHIIKAKKDLAKNISTHLSTVLVDGNTPDGNNMKAAKERLEQQLLIRLSDAYSIDTVLQFDVDVKSPYQGTGVMAPNLFGKVLDPSDTSTPDQKAYAFSTTRFSLQQSADPQRSYLSILFNTKKENLKAEDSSYFPINLNYEINSIEHDISGVTGIPDYKSSSWLSFILPFSHENTGLGDLKIPIPLRAYPTSPSLTAQGYIAHCPQFNQQAMLSLHDEDKLPVAKAWDYEYSYDYLRAQQDTIYTDILLNIKQNALNAGLFKDDTDPDLFAALLQFSNAYPAIQADLNRYLLDQSNPQFALSAMKSFAWLAGRIAKAWGTWTEQKDLYTDFSAGDANYKYQVIEDHIDFDGQTILAITVTPRDGTVYALPDIHVPGWEMKVHEETAEKKTFIYYNTVDGVKQYLTPSIASGITARSIRFKGFNIIKEENSWSGLSIVRNKILVPGIPTNDDFIYETPVIRFVNILTPLLDPDIDINMAVYTLTGKHKLQQYISNFFKAFFDEIKDKTTTRVVKTAVNYSYTLNADPDGLRVDIPISMTTPYEFKIPADWDVSKCDDTQHVTPQDSFICQLAALLNTWFKNHQPITTNGILQFDVSLFASLSDSQLPVLHIRKIKLDINIVDLA